MAKILHTGDIHLDSAFVGLSSEAARKRRAGLRELMSEIIDVANAEAVDAIILAGDIFDSYPIRPETAESFLRDLKRSKAPVFISPGNHDPYTADSPYRTLEFPSNVHIFCSPTLTPVELPECSLRIFGAAYTSSVFDERILKDFKVPEDDFINIISLHSNLYTDGYSPVSEEEISETGADYIALAHVHKPTEILKSKNTYYAYCGCLEARDFGEQYDTGLYLGEVSKGNVNLKRYSLSDIRYREETIDIEVHPDIISGLSTPSSGEHLRLTLVGECTSPDIDAIYEQLSPKYLELIINDRTTAPRDLWQGLTEDNLRGVFLKKMKAALDSCESEAEKDKILLAVKFGIDAIENRDV